MKSIWYFYVKCKSVLYRIVKLDMAQKKTYMGKYFRTLEETNDFLREMIQRGEPFSLIRPGFDELNLVALWDEHVMWKTNRFKKMNTSSSMFMNNEKAIEKWVKVYKHTLQNADIIGVARTQIMGEYLWKQYVRPTTEFVDMFFYSADGILQVDHPWTMALRNKKVLIVSMLTDSMQSQYEKMRDIWGDKEVLPDMDILWLKSVFFNPLTDNDGMADAFGVLEKMKEQIRELDFDIALLCCSWFGTFLVPYITDMGKIAIQMGGNLQLLFGIKGNRWDKEENINQFYNRYWIRPSQIETPENYQQIENGCYW